MTTDGTFVTTELGLASYLRCCGFEPERMERINDRSAQWVFISDDGLADLAADYQCGDAEVEPREFIRTLSRTRRGLYSFMANARP